jgi:hypothetical protein
MDRPLISLSENYGVVTQRSDWPVLYVSEHDPRYVPKAVQALGGEVRHVLYYQPGNISLWWQVRDKGDVWRYVLQTG